MVVTNDHKIEQRDIETGIETDNGVAVTKGLQAGDLVVVANRGSLKPGESVTPKEVK